MKSGMVVPERFFVFTDERGVRFGVEYPFNEVSKFVVPHVFTVMRKQLEELGVKTRPDRVHDQFIFEEAPVIAFVATKPSNAAMMLRDW